MFKVIFLGFTSQKYDGHGIKIDRADLTRKMSCMETWVPRIEDKKHEVIFFDGGHEKTFFDKKNKILHTSANDSYDYHFLQEQGKGSLMFERLKTAIKWVLENREFDYIFRIDDGSYVNSFKLEEMIDELQGWDIVMGQGGGAGMFLSKQTCERLINFNNETKIHIEDLSLYRFFELNSDLKLKHSNLLTHQYILSEDLFTIHYTNGKRQYTTDTIISYYYNSRPLDRKVILNYNLNYLEPLKCNTWDSVWETTPVFYSFDRDKFEWEHYGKLARSSYSVIATCPFAKNSLKELMFYDTHFDFSKPNESQTFKKYIDSLKSDGTIYLFYENSKLNKEVFDYLELIKHSSYIDIDVEYIKNKPGNFYKLRKLYERK
jgi:hypothetical protein